MQCRNKDNTFNKKPLTLDETMRKNTTQTRKSNLKHCKKQIIKQLSNSTKAIKTINKHYKNQKETINKQCKKKTGENS